MKRSTTPHRLLSVLLLSCSTAGALCSAQERGDSLLLENRFRLSLDIMAYEKSLDSKVETFLVRNNTLYTVTGVELKLVYKTTNNLMIHHRTVEIEERLRPNSTKLVQIESFDQNKRYFYYKTGLEKGDNGYPFVVNPELIRYEIEVTVDHCPMDVLPLDE